MTASELLALLGLAWWRLLVYPGGFALLAAIGLATRAYPLRADASAHRHTLGVQTAFYVAIIAPWLAIALLPLPGTRPLNRALDVFVTLALLDAPLFVAVATSLRSDAEQWRHGARRLVALNGFPVLILAFALLSGGALTFDALAQVPDPADLRATAAHWLGAVTLLLALPALLNLGPFAMQQADTHAQKPAFPHICLELGLWLRAIGLTLLAALPWLPLLGERFWLAPLPPLLIALELWAFHRLVRRGTPRRWGWAYVGLVIVQLLVLLARDLRVNQ